MTRSSLAGVLVFAREADRSANRSPVSALRMYESFFGFDCRPFAETPNPDLTFWTNGHRNALSVIELGLDRGSQVTVLTGGPGTGKTTLVRHLLGAAAGGLSVRLLTGLDGERSHLLQSVLSAFDQDDAPGSDAVLVHHVERLFTDERAHGRRCVLIVDDAERLSAGEFEELRRLSELNTSEILVMLVLVGAPELRVKLSRKENGRLRQRVGAEYHLMPFTADETDRYVRDRIVQAGGPEDLFDDAALREVHRAAKGIPRKIDHFCDIALTLAFAGRAPRVNRNVVQSAIKEARRHETSAEPSELDVPAPDEADTDAAIAELFGFDVQDDIWDFVEDSGDAPAPAATHEASPDGAPAPSTQLFPRIPPPGDARDLSEEAPPARAPGAAPAGAGPRTGMAGSQPVPDAAARPQAAADPASVFSPGMEAEASLRRAFAPRKDWRYPARLAALAASGSIAAAIAVTLLPDQSGSALRATAHWLDGHQVPAAPRALDEAPPASPGPSIVSSKAKEDTPRRLAAFEGRGDDAPPMAPVWLTAAPTDRLVLQGSPVAAAGADDPVAAREASPMPAATPRPSVTPGEAIGAPAPPVDVALLAMGAAPLADRPAPARPAPAPAADAAGAETAFARALRLATEDPHAAAIAYARAALLGHERAAYYLGQIYETGDGVPVDFAIARHWYEVASTGNARAQRRLAELPAPERGQLAAPLPLLAEAVGAGAIDVVWTSGPGADPTAYVVEISADPRAGASVAYDVTGSAARLPLDVRAAHWRVLALDRIGGRPAVSEWRPISPTTERQSALVVPEAGAQAAVAPQQPIAAQIRSR